MTIASSVDIGGSSIQDFRVLGTCTGRPRLTRCVLDGLSGITGGAMRECVLTANGFTLDSTASSLTLLDCASAVSGADAPIDINGAPVNLRARSFSGDLEVRNASNATTDISLDMDPGSVLFAATCTAGAAKIEGLGAGVTNSGTITVDETGYNPGGSGGGGSEDWTAAEREQIRSALGVDGTKTTAVGGQVQDILAHTSAVDGRLPTDPADASDITDAFGAVNTELSAIQGAGFDTATDSLEQIRDNLGTGGTTPADVWQYATRTLTAGTRDAEIDAIKGQTDALTFTGGDVRATLDGEAVTTDAASRDASKADVASLATDTALTSALNDILADLGLVKGSGFASADDSLVAIKAAVGSGSIDPQVVRDAMLLAPGGPSVVGSIDRLLADLDSQIDAQTADLKGLSNRDLTEVYNAAQTSGTTQIPMGSAIDMVVSEPGSVTMTVPPEGVITLEVVE